MERKKVIPVEYKDTFKSFEEYEEYSKSFEEYKKWSIEKSKNQNLIFKKIEYYFTKFNFDSLIFQFLITSISIC